MIVLNLYVFGETGAHARAIANLRSLTKVYSAHELTVEIVDISQNPQTAVDKHITATPILVKTAPLPEQRLVGDLSDADTVRLFLGLYGKEKEHSLEKGNTI